MNFHQCDIFIFQQSHLFTRSELHTFTPFGWMTLYGRKVSDHAIMHSYSNNDNENNNKPGLFSSTIESSGVIQCQAREVTHHSSDSIQAMY